LLASAYRTSLKLAAERGANVVCFPSISTGVYGYPVEQAAAVALRVVAEFLTTGADSISIKEAVFVLFDRDTFTAYETALRSLQNDD